jgi:hypothetical protein
MAKLVELSVLIALIAVPAAAAMRESDPAKGLRKALVHTLWFNVIYLLLMMFVHGRLL